MNAAKRDAKRGLLGKGLLLIGIWGVGALLMALFWLRDSDVAAARDEVRRERSPSSDDTAPYMPKITREDFEFKLPVPGEKGKYQWKVGGRRAVSVSPTTDRITGFTGEMIDRGDVVHLSSDIALFDKEKKTLSARDNVVLEADWARIEAPEMSMDMETNDTVFSGNVTTRIDTEKAPTGPPSEASPAPGNESGPAENPSGKPKPKKKKAPLVITSEEVHVYRKKNLVVFVQDVVAVDESGTILADKMEALNYTKEETEKDPKLTGVKTVRCIGNVKITQVVEGEKEKQKQARCALAVYDAKTNTAHLYHDAKTGKKVVYRDEVEQWQAEANEMILYRDRSEVKFIGGVRTIDFNPDRKSFLGFMEPESTKPGSEKPGSGSGEKPQSEAE